MGFLLGFSTHLCQTEGVSPPGKRERQVNAMSSADDTFEAVEEQAGKDLPPGFEKRTSWKSFFFFFRKFFCL